MKPFALVLQSSTDYTRFDDVLSFVGEDGSGSFGLLAGHGRFMTTLVFGLARFRRAQDPALWHFLAVPGAVIYFANNELSVSTRHYLLDDDYARISTALMQQLLAEEQNLNTMKASLRELEEHMLRRLWQLRRVEEAGR
jgi:F-type H+-transporting ATPase subunit epsilon